MRCFVIVWPLGFRQAFLLAARNPVTMRFSPSISSPYRARIIIRLAARIVLENCFTISTISRWWWRGGGKGGMMNMTATIIITTILMIGGSCVYFYEQLLRTYAFGLEMLEHPLWLFNFLIVDSSAVVCVLLLTQVVENLFRLSYRASDMVLVLPCWFLYSYCFLFPSVCYRALIALKIVASDAHYCLNLIICQSSHYLQYHKLTVSQR